jgi:hypothetical protein
MPRLSTFANLFFLLSFCILTSSAFGVESDQAWTAIDRADSAIASAYQAVLEVEEAGANASGLLKDLDFGAEALAKANILYRIEDFDEAVYFAELCYDSVVEVTAEANRLRDLAVTERKQRLLLTSLTSTFGVGFVILGGILGWRLFKRWYYRRVLKMRPDLNRKNVLENCS